MADEGGYDPCECVCSTQWAMRRLLSILRTSQQYCTDNECLPELPGTGEHPNQDMNTYLMFILWFFVLLFLFIHRPASFRRPIGDQKPNNGDGDHHQPPPDVPPVQ